MMAELRKKLSPILVLRDMLRGTINSQPPDFIPGISDIRHQRKVFPQYKHYKPWNEENQVGRKKGGIAAAALPPSGNRQRCHN